VQRGALTMIMAVSITSRSVPLYVRRGVRPHPRTTSFVRKVGYRDSSRDFQVSCTSVSALLTMARASGVCAVAHVVYGAFLADSRVLNASVRAQNLLSNPRLLRRLYRVFYSCAVVCECCLFW